MAIRISQGMINPKLDNSDIGMGESRISRKPEYSTCFLTCIGFVAIKNDISVVGHFSGIAEGKDDEVSSFGLAIISAKLIGADRFWLVGGGPCLVDGVDIVEDDRDLATEIVTEVLPPDGILQTRWTEKRHIVVDLVVDPKDSIPVTLYESPAI